MLEFYYFGKLIFNSDDRTPINIIKHELNHYLNKSNDYYFVSNGKIISDTNNLQKCVIHIQPRLVGGKGGFGSMLRAIGAQIEKTTNREACRDLSGRRLRDINEEKRLKAWIAQQAEREKQSDDRRQKKLERLCHQPKHEFKDEAYEKVRSELPEKVQDALEQGLKVSCSGISNKRKHTNNNKQTTKKSRLWMGSDEELSSSIETDSEGEDSSKAKIESTNTQTNLDSPDKLISVTSNQLEDDKQSDSSKSTKENKLDGSENITSLDQDNKLSEHNNEVKLESDNDKIIPKGDEINEQKVQNNLEN